MNEVFNIQSIEERERNKSEAGGKGMRRILGKLHTFSPPKFCRGKISSWPTEWKWSSLALAVDICSQRRLNLRLTPFRDTIPSISLDYILLEESTALLAKLLWGWRCEGPLCLDRLLEKYRLLHRFSGRANTLSPSQEPSPPFDFDPPKGRARGREEDLISFCFLTYRSVLFSWTATHNNFTSQSSLTTITGWTQERFAAQVAPRHRGRQTRANVFV